MYKGIRRKGDSMSEDKARLNRAVNRSIKKVFKDALSLVEMSGLDQKQYNRIRKMILRSGNDEIRKISEELDKYEVKYTPRYDEQIDFDREED
jgi:Na+/phosphate symporter